MTNFFNRAINYGIRRIISVVEKCVGVNIFVTLPHGVDPLHDLEREIPRWRPTTIFDVGANVGQSAVIYAKQYPAARILSFEPVVETFQRLTKSVSRFRNIECFNLAFAARVGEGRLAKSSQSDMNRIVPEAPVRGVPSSEFTERVKMETIDDFCAANRIAKIDYLKIDTEGGDLDVLRGAARMLQEGRIDVIEVEAGIGLDNDLHVPLQEFRSYLEEHGCRLFGFYEQMSERIRRLPHLRRTNVVFISKAIDESLGKH